jgi:hypothetical protein
MARSNTRWLVAIVVAGSLAIVACSGDDANTATTVAPTTTGSPETTEPVETTEAPDTSPAPETTESPDTAPDTTALPTAEWETIVPGGDCACSDGSEFEFYVRRADPTKVVLYFQGGGACFDASTCSPTSGTYVPVISKASHPDATPFGLFDFDDPRNPIANHSVVFVPYCTGDVHIGNAVQEYSDTLTIQHKGFVNGSAALDYLIRNFPEVDELLVSGESAGSIPSPLYAGLASDRLPDVTISVLGDGSGGYPDNPVVNAAIGSLWGAFTVVPDWPVNQGLTAEQWGIPRLWIQAGLHNPELRLARYDYAFDFVQAQFNALTGLTTLTVLDAIDMNDQMFADAGVKVASYTAPGDAHTILRFPGYYDQEVDGVPLNDWVTSFLAGEDVPNVRCTDCQG